MAVDGRHKGAVSGACRWCLAGPFACDLASLRSVRACAAEVQRLDCPLDVVVLNAGLQFTGMPRHWIEGGGGAAQYRPKLLTVPCYSNGQKEAFSTQDFLGSDLFIYCPAIFNHRSFVGRIFQPQFYLGEASFIYTVVELQKNTNKCYPAI